MSTSAFARCRPLAAAALVSIAAGSLAQVEGAGPALAQKHQCLSCHKVDGPLVGPAFRAVAQRYKDDANAAETLAAKVKNGGKGAWGKVPMPSNKGVSDEDLKTLVSWVLAAK